MDLTKDSRPGLMYKRIKLLSQAGPEIKNWPVGGVAQQVVTMGQLYTW